MSTTSGAMKSFRVTDPNGNVYILTPVDTTARTAAANAEAKAISLNVDSVKYKNIVSDPNLAVYDPTATYAVGDFCYYENELYECNTAISTAEAWDETHWTKIIVKDLIDAAKAAADEAAQAIEGAKDLTFDEQYFIPDETDTEVNITLNGVPFGVDDETPLRILQDTQDGLVLGVDSPFNSAIAAPFDGTAAYEVGDRVTYKGKLYRCTTAIDTPTSVWDPSDWTETSVDEEMNAVDPVTDVIITSADNSTISFVTNGVADLTPLYTYVKSLEDRVAALEAAQVSEGITVNGIQPTVNGNTITVGE